MAKRPVPEGTIDEKGNIFIDPKGTSLETAERLRYWLAAKYDVPVEDVVVTIRPEGGYRWSFPVRADKLSDDAATAKWRNPLTGSPIPRGEA